MPPPLDFLLWVIFGLSGVHLAALAATAYLGSGGGWRGLLPAAMVCVWMAGGLSVSTRVWILPEERENWALPFLSLRGLAMLRLLLRAEGANGGAGAAGDKEGRADGHEEAGREAARGRRLRRLEPSLVLPTALFCLLWQFAPFVLAMQTIAALAAGLTGAFSVGTYDGTTQLG